MIYKVAYLLSVGKRLMELETQAHLKNKIDTMVCWMPDNIQVAYDFSDEKIGKKLLSCLEKNCEDKYKQYSDWFFRDVFPNFDKEDWEVFQRFISAGYIEFECRRQARFRSLNN